LRISVKVTKRNNWKCPFGFCSREFGNFVEIGEHIQNEREEHEKNIYFKVGAFWASLLRCLKASRKWPTVLEIFASNENQAHIEMSPMAGFGADIIWKHGQHTLTYQHLADTRVLPETPLEPLLRRFIRDAG
jgi:hypothetical protein